MLRTVSESNVDDFHEDEALEETDAIVDHDLNERLTVQKANKEVSKAEK